MPYAQLVYCSCSLPHRSQLDSRASTFHSEKRLVKLRVETRATFATIFVATQVTRPHAVITRSLIVTLNARTWMLTHHRHRLASQHFSLGKETGQTPCRDSCNVCHATQVTRPHAVTTRSLIVTHGCSPTIGMQVVSLVPRPIFF